MAENIPGVRAQEYDASSSPARGADGIPAGVIGTALEGPAFVPVTVGNYGEFQQIFGMTDKVTEKSLFGPVAAEQWLKNANALTYVRVLGAGDGKTRNVNDTVTNAGFVVGEELPLDTGYLGSNIYANSTDPSALGRTYFLGCYMSESAGSTIFTDANIQTHPTELAHPILRGVLFAASGTSLTLSCSNGTAVNNDPGATSTTESSVGFITGTVDFASDSAVPMFTMIIKGLKNTDDNVIKASLDPSNGNYFPTKFNTDPALLQQRGHLLYTHYDVFPQYAVVTGSGITQQGPNLINNTAEQYVGSSDCVFLTTGSTARNTLSGDAPNYEGFQSRFAHARSPWIVSQKFGGSAKNLFRIHAQSDGVLKSKANDPAGANTKFKISIADIDASNETFTLIVRDFYDQDPPSQQNVLKTYTSLSLNPSSAKYIGRVIGDRRVSYDFDQPAGSQKIIIEGKYANPANSNLIRVELAPELENGEIDSSALPVGFRGLDHLITSGSSPMTSPPDANLQANNTDILKRVVEPPTPFRQDLLMASGTIQAKANGALFWGVQFQRKEQLAKPNADSQIDNTVVNLTKFFPNFYGANSANMNVMTGSNPGQTTSSGIIFDSDVFNNNGFSLENIRVMTGSGPNNDLVLSTDAGDKEWRYVRDGNIVTNDVAKTRAWQVSDTNSPRVRSRSKFSLPIQGGWDGVNIFDSSEANLTEKAAKGDMDDSNRGQNDGPTVAAYYTALNVMADKSDVDIQLLAIPGIRQETITDRAITKVEQRFDALYIMDIEERDNVNTVVTSSAQLPVVSNTVTSFEGRSLDTSFAAAYFPNVSMTVTQKRLNSQTRKIIEDHPLVTVPPSAAVLGAFAANDRFAFPWFAPAGFTRGAMSDVVSSEVSLTRDDMEDLVGVDINPIQSFPGSDGPVVYGQRTLQQAASALDRVNVRRLLIDVRRSVRAAANSILFEPNREATLAKLSAQVRPILKNVQQNAGIDRFKVLIDSSTTTQADIENNTVRGKIFLQPTRTAEFISLDFVVTNTGAKGI